MWIAKKGLTVRKINIIKKKNNVYCRGSKVNACQRSCLS